MLKLDINLLFTVINLVVWYLLIKKFLFFQQIGLLKVVKTCDEFVEAAHDGSKR